MDSSLLQIPLATARYVRFGHIQIDQQRQRVIRDGNELRLQPKAFEVLIALLLKQGEVVTREQLKRTLWSIESQANHDAHLNTTINKLRRALGESIDKVSYIETIPRRGYRFTGKAEVSDIPFAGINPAISISDVIVPDREQKAREHNALRSGKSRTVIMLTVFLTGVLLGATAATFWLSRDASQVRHSAFGSLDVFRCGVAVYVYV
jgi:DNA-binding winged helix-turn-helix (wHTH) protein